MFTDTYYTIFEKMLTQKASKEAEASPKKAEMIGLSLMGRLFSPFLQFNFVGKLLGPKGNSMKRLQEETMTKMAVLGRGSMRDKQKVI